jgi:hypothetical protein
MDKHSELRQWIEIANNDLTAAQYMTNQGIRLRAIPSGIYKVQCLNRVNNACAATYETIPLQLLTVLFFSILSVICVWR